MKKRILFSASLFHASNDAVSVTIPMIFPLLYSRQWLITKYSHIGILSYLGLLVTFLFQFLIASSSYRFKYKQILLFSLMGLAFSLILLTYSWSFASLLAFYLFLRFFTSFYHPVGVSMVSKTHPEQGIDFAMGVQSGSGNFGVFSAFILTGVLAEKFGWKVPLSTWAALCFFLGILSYLSVRKIATLHEDVQKPSLSAWISALKSIRKYIPGFVFGGACWGTTVYYAPSLFNHKFHISLAQTGIYMAFWIGIGTVMTYLFGYISRRIGRAVISLGSFIGSTVFLFLLGSAPTVKIAVLSLFLFGSFLFLLYPAFQSFVGNSVSSEYQTLAFSLVANVQMLSGSFTSLTAGFLSDEFGIHSPFYLLAGLGILISLTYAIIKLPPRTNPNNPSQ